MSKLVKLVADAPRTHDPDAVLLEAVASGDTAAFNALHQRYYAKVFSFALRIVKAHDRAEEIANDTMLTVWRKADRFDGRSRVSSWVFGIVYRIALKSRRRFWFERSHVELDETLGLTDQSGPTIDSLFLRRQISEALRALPIELRAIVELTYNDGMSYSEISEIVGCPVGTVKSRMSTARQRMRQHFEKTAQ